MKNTIVYPIIKINTGEKVYSKCDFHNLCTQPRARPNLDVADVFLFGKQISAHFLSCQIAARMWGYSISNFYFNFNCRQQRSGKLEGTEKKWQKTNIYIGFNHNQQEKILKNESRFTFPFNP
jgi:hypothetical protein